MCSKLIYVSISLILCTINAVNGRKLRQFEFISSLDGGGVSAVSRVAGRDEDGNYPGDFEMLYAAAIRNSKGVWDCRETCNGTYKARSVRAINAGSNVTALCDVDVFDTNGKLKVVYLGKLLVEI